MPEGPSIVILKEQVLPFKGQKILSAAGNAKIDFKRMEGLKVLDLKSWGKHFLICFRGFYVRIHLLMFGTYRINERKDTEPRLSLAFKTGELNFYTCSIKLMEGDVNDDYDWEADVMSNEWSAIKAQRKLRNLESMNVCDVLLDQEIFSGVGNIIKNEVLFRTRIHPASSVGTLPSGKVRELVKEARNYSFDFYEWKKAFTLKQHWLIYKKNMCPRCKIPAHTAYLGKGKRLTSYCDNCQVVYEESKKTKCRDPFIQV